MVLTLKQVSQHVSVSGIIEVSKRRSLDWRAVDGACWSIWGLHRGRWGSTGELGGGQGRGNAEKSCTEWILMSLF